MKYRFMLLCITSVLFFSGCAGSSPAGRIRPAGRLLPMLSRKLEVLGEKAKRFHSFLGSGFFYYKDKKRELNLSVRILREGDLFRITFRGNLDNTLWADLLVKNGAVTLYFPLQRTLYKAVLKGFDLYSFAGIHVTMEELLQLASLYPYLIPDAANVESLEARSRYVVFRESKREQQKIILDKKQLLISRSLVYRNKRIRGDIHYSLYKDVAGDPLPFKCKLTVPGAGVQALLWLRTVKAGSHFTKNEGIIQPGATVSVREL